MLRPTVIKSLEGHARVAVIDGGNQHSVAVTVEGECLVWGRLDAHALGLDAATLPSEDVIRDGRGNARILKVATAVPGLKAVYAAAGSDHSIAIQTDGKAYSWGFGADCQTGQGADDEITRPTLIDNTAVRGKVLLWAGAGGQYSMVAMRSELPNGLQKH